MFNWWKNRRTPLALMAVMLLVLQVVTGCSILPQEEEFRSAPLVKEYEGAMFSKYSVKSGDIIEAEDIECTYHTADVEDLSFSEEGYEVDKVSVKVGDKVEEGDVLATIAVDDASNQVEECRYNIKKTELAITHENEMMAAEIEKQKVVSNDASAIKSIQDQHQATIDAYKDDLKIYKLQLSDAKDLLDSYSLIAGISGTVTFVKDGLQGSNSIMGETVITITGKSETRFTANTKYASKYKDGSFVTVTTAVQNVKCLVSHSKSSKNKLFLTPTSDVQGLQDGTTGTVEYIINQRLNVLYVPKQAVYNVDGKTVVYYEDESGMKAQKEIVTGLTFELRTEVVSGLSLGDSIITN